MITITDEQLDAAETRLDAAITKMANETDRMWLLRSRGPFEDSLYRAATLAEADQPGVGAPIWFAITLMLIEQQTKGKSP